MLITDTRTPAKAESKTVRLLPVSADSVDTAEQAPFVWFDATKADFNTLRARTARLRRQPDALRDLLRAATLELGRRAASDDKRQVPQDCLPTAVRFSAWATPLVHELFGNAVTRDAVHARFRIAWAVANLVNRGRAQQIMESATVDKSALLQQALDAQAVTVELSDRIPGAAWVQGKEMSLLMDQRNHNRRVMVLTAHDLVDCAESMDPEDLIDEGFNPDEYVAWAKQRAAKAGWVDQNAAANRSTLRLVH